MPRQFFPASDRPELLVDLTLPQNASIYASETAAQTLRRALKGDPDVERWSTYVGRGAIRFYLPLNVQLPNDFFTPGGDRRQGRRGARPPAGRSSSRCWPTSSRASSRASLRSSSGRRSAGRCSTASAGPIVGRCARSRSSSPRSSPPTRSRAGQLRLDRAGARGAHPRRPGRGAPARPELAGAGQRAQHRHLRHAGHAGARRHLSRQRRGPRHRRAARLARRPCATLQVPLPNGRTVPLSQFATFEYTQDYPADLAARPRADPDRAGRRRAGRAAGDGRRRLAPAIDEAGRDPAAGLSHRRRRHGRGERRIAGLGRRRRAGRCC